MTNRSGFCSRLAAVVDVGPGERVVVSAHAEQLTQAVGTPVGVALNLRGSVTLTVELGDADFQGA
jgi:hypothetical protein